MEKLGGYNKENKCTTSQNQEKMAGVLCDLCGEEMYYTGMGICLTTYPATYKNEVKCGCCGYTGYKNC